MVVAHKYKWGQSTTDHLAHGREIWCDTEMCLGTAVADPEAGHHLVKPQQSAVLFGEFPQTFKEAGFRLNEAGVADDRLEECPPPVLLVGSMT